MRRSFAAGIGVIGALMAGSVAAEESHSDLQERYCTGDAFRLCSSEIPDVDRITACMTRQRRLLSPACRAVFDDPEPAAAATGRATSVARGKASKPMQLVPD